MAKRFLMLDEEHASIDNTDLVILFGAVDRSPLFPGRQFRRGLARMLAHAVKGLKNDLAEELFNEVEAAQHSLTLTANKQIWALNEWTYRELAAMHWLDREDVFASIGELWCYRQLAK